MMQITGTITTSHSGAACVAAALSPDNLPDMTTIADEECVVTKMTGTQLRSVIASMDDYLMNLAIADDACSMALMMKDDTGQNRTKNTRVR